MLFRAPVLLMAAGLLHLATALPTEQPHSDSTLAPRDSTYCEVNKAFYVCKAKNFRGCCSVDPCTLEGVCPDKARNKNPNQDNSNSNSNSNDNDNKKPDPASGTCKPKPKPSTPSCPPGGQKRKLFLPKMQTLVAGSPPISTPNFNLSKSDSGETQQRMAWQLPAKAKDCTIGWSVPAERNFKAGRNSLVNVYYAKDNDSKAPFYANSAEDKKALGNANFAFWPETPGKRTNVVSAVQCKEDLAFRLQMVHKDQVFIEQNGETGWWVEYTC